MSFLYPGFLWALAALAVPIVIHLFSFRRYKRVLFTNVRLLAGVEKESKSRNKLRQWLLLLLRLLALACILLAFAQPYIPQKQAAVSAGKNYLAFYIDNSFSMAAQGKEGDLLQTAKKKAEEIAKAYREGDGFLLVTNDFEGRHQRWLNRGEFVSLLQEVIPSPVSRKLSEVNRRIGEAFRQAEAGNKLVYFLSDFQGAFADAEAMQADSAVRYHGVPLRGPAAANVYIDSAWLETPLFQIGQANVAKARIVNASDKAIEESSITLKVNNQQKALAAFSLPANGNAVVELPFTITQNGFNQAALSINDYPITFDDTWYLSYYVAPSVPVLGIIGGAPAPYLGKLFGTEKAFSYNETSIGSVDYGSLRKYKLVILHEPKTVSTGLAAAMRGYVEEGGNLLFVPAAENPDLPSYSALLEGFNAGSIEVAVVNTGNVSTIESKHPFFSGVFEGSLANVNLPSAKQAYPLRLSSVSRGQSLMQLGNGNPFLLYAPAVRGNVFTVAAPLSADWTNLRNHALFLPLVYRMALFTSSAEKLGYVLGVDNYVQYKTEAAEKEQLYLRKDKFEVIPPQRTLNGNLSLYVEGLLRDAGYYTLSRERGGQTQGVYAFNYDRRESQMQFPDMEDMQKRNPRLNWTSISPEKASLTAEVRSLQQGTTLWRYLVMAALAFLLAESLLMRKLG